MLLLMLSSLLSAKLNDVGIRRDSSGLFINVASIRSGETTSASVAASRVLLASEGSEMKSPLKLFVRASDVGIWHAEQRDKNGDHWIEN